jgi:hypothetical protein
MGVLPLPVPKITCVVAGVHVILEVRGVSGPQNYILRTIWIESDYIKTASVYISM